MSQSPTRQENIQFLYYAIKRVWMEAGGSEEHAHYIADAISFAHKQGKLNQGLGVYEALDIALEMGLLDIKAVPEVVDDGPGWATVDGHRSSGYWCLNIMADLAIQKAREQGIAIVFGGNHNDAGSFARYVYKAFEQDMLAFSSNNTVPLAAPFGGLHNKLSCAPFDAIAPAGDKPPVWASVALAEFYDADVAEAGIYNKPWNNNVNVPRNSYTISLTMNTQYHQQRLLEITLKRRRFLNIDVNFQPRTVPQD